MQPSLVIRSVSCYLKINFSVWFSLKVASENYTHSQRPQGRRYNLNKLGMFESINKCICLHPLQHHVHGRYSGESSKKGLRISPKQQENSFQGQGEVGTQLPVRGVKLTQRYGSGSISGKTLGYNEELSIFVRTNFLEQFQVHDKTERKVERFRTYSLPLHVHSLTQDQRLSPEYTGCNWWTYSDTSQSHEVHSLH